MQLHSRPHLVTPYFCLTKSLKKLRAVQTLTKKQPASERWPNCFHNVFVFHLTDEYDKTALTKWKLYNLHVLSLLILLPKRTKSSVITIYSLTKVQNSHSNITDVDKYNGRLICRIKAVRRDQCQVECLSYLSFILYSPFYGEVR